MTPLSGGARTFRIGERVQRGEEAVLADLRDPTHWERALGGRWHGEVWSWSLPRAGSAAVVWRPAPRGVSVSLRGELASARVEISVVADDDGGSTVIADVQVSAGLAVPGAWWVELQRVAAPRWLTALTAGAPAGTGPTDG